MSRACWVLAVCIASVPLVQHEIDRRTPERVDREARLYVRTGERLRQLAPGFSGLLADLYWLRTVQYYGHQHAFAQKARYDALDPLVTTTVTLEPRFELAYRYGAIFLSEPWPNGAGEPEKALALLRRGFRNLPQAWQLHWDMGVIQYQYLSDAQGAAESLQTGSRLPGAPYWLRTLAADILAKKGDREMARRLWTAMYENSEGALKDNAAVHLARLEALDLVDMLEDRAKLFKTTYGRWPKSLGELQQAGLIRSVPKDPSGLPFLYNPESGRVEIAHQSRLFQKR